MSEEGYTLVEMLVALMIIGFATAALLTGVGVIGRQQAAAVGLLSDVQALRDARTHLELLLSRAAAIRVRDAGHFTGESAGFHFPCGASADCSAQLRDGREGLTLVLDDGAPRSLALRRTGPAHFLYQGRLSESAAWPPADLPPDNLRAISIVTTASGPANPVVVARIWPEQPAQCAFDVISQDCQ